MLEAAKTGPVTLEVAAARALRRLLANARGPPVRAANVCMYDTVHTVRRRGAWTACPRPHCASLCMPVVLVGCANRGLNEDQVIEPDTMSVVPGSSVQGVPRERDNKSSQVKSSPSKPRCAMFATRTL